MRCIHERFELSKEAILRESHPETATGQLQRSARRW